MRNTLQFCSYLQFLIQLKYAKEIAVLKVFAILDTVKIWEVHCSFLVIYNSWCSRNRWSTLQFCWDLQFLVQLKYVKYTAVLWGFTILGTVKICEVHCSFVGIYNSWCSWNLWSTLQFCRYIQVLVQLKYAKYTAVF